MEERFPTRAGPGERYQVEVLFFAENEAGYDSRRQTWEVTAE